MTPKQARQYSFVQADEGKPAVVKPVPKKPRKPRQEACASEVVVPVENVAIGDKWRCRKRLPWDNPPDVGTVCAVWQITERRVFLLGDGYSFDLSREQLGEYFSEEVAEC